MALQSDIEMRKDVRAWTSPLTPMRAHAENENGQMGRLEMDADGGDGRISAAVTVVLPAVSISVYR